MSIRIGHAAISEKGTINGKKGDSTKTEVCIRTWYSHPWDYMAIHPDAAVREKHAASVEAVCANDKIGYGQNDRNTLNTVAKAVGYKFDKIIDPCNCDCSSLQNTAAVASGAPGVTYGSNGWTTRSMKTALKNAGYKIIEDATYLSSGMYCVRGAIYVKHNAHTVCGLDNGSKSTQTLKKAGIAVPAKKPVAEASYYSIYTGTSSSIDTIFKAIGVPAQYYGKWDKRVPVANANGISNYTGTASQNTTLKNLARQGKLKKVVTATVSYYPAYTGTSSGIDTIFRAIGVPEQYCGKWDKRIPVAEANGITGYTGTSSQNTTLKNLARQGKLKKV